MIQLRFLFSPCKRFCAYTTLLLFSLTFSPPAHSGTLDDCGYLFVSSDGCLLFVADNHDGYYRLSNYGEFVSGARVHVSGEHNANRYGPCKSSVIQYNSITEGCSQLCTGIPRDVNNDSRTNVGDLTLLVAYIFRGDQSITCTDQADCNNNGRLEISDVTCLLGAM